MNRKLRNTLLAFSVTGTVLAMGLIVARPAAPLQAAQPAATAHQAAEAIPTGVSPMQGLEHVGQGEPAAVARELAQAHLLAHSHRYEQEIANARSLEDMIAGTAGLLAATTTEAVLAEVLSAEGAASAEADRSAPAPAKSPRRHRGSVRGAVAVPYFSFARGMGRGGRS